MQDEKPPTLTPDPEAAPAPFKLLPWDCLAVEVIEQWISRARACGVNAGKIARAEKHLAEIVAWQATNPFLVKLPD